MLTGIHILLTYRCTLECDHCFVYSSPRAEGTMTMAQVRSVLSEARRIGTVEWIYFEGGEPLLFSQSLLEEVAMAREAGFEVGIVTNAYWAVSGEDAEAWLRPLARLGVGDLSISDDLFHYGDREDTPAKTALAAAHRLGIPTKASCIEKPLLKGRAVEKLTEGLPRRRSEDLSTCPYEDLRHPSRVHVDAYGNVHVCQGLSIGNMWERPLSDLMRDHAAETHPVCGPLVRGGPAALAGEYGLHHEGEYVDECHFCYLMRRALVDRFPVLLAPRQVYDLGQEEGGSE